MTSSSSSVSDRSSLTTPKQGGQDLREKLNLWESNLATLSDRQKDGVMTLSAVANSRPMPKDVSDVDLFQLYRSCVFLSVASPK